MPDERTDWRRAVRDMAWRMAREDYEPSDLARLRRLDPDGPDEAPFWRLVAQHAPAAFDHEQAASALAIAVQGMAIVHPFHVVQGDRRSLGQALAESGVSEMRLLRLLRLGRSDLPEEVRRLARLMASKGDAGRFEWADIFDLAFWPKGEAVRRRLARDYYRTLYRQTTSQGEPA